MELKRRELLAAAAGAVLLPRQGWTQTMPDDVRITRVVSFELELTRPKHVGKNSYRHDHGTRAWDRVVRFYTDAGIDGFGPCWSGANECAAFLGQSPRAFFDRSRRRVTGTLGRFTAPIWDLVGKLEDRPVYELLGGAGPDRVAVYDGTIYFVDLRPGHRKDWRDQFKRELDLAIETGHRAFKIKVGRGRLWMLTEEGYARDVEVVRHIRKHVGEGVKLMVDANDGYDLERTKRFLLDTAECQLTFVEEMFPDSLSDWSALRAFMKEERIPCLIADGENCRRVEQMQPWVEVGAVDILQADMNLLGFEDILAEAEMAASSGARIAPHNWGSLLGYYLQLQVGRAVPNFFMAEQDLLSCPAIVADGFEIREGKVSVPDAPGLGLRIDDSKLGDGACVHFDLEV